MKPQSETVQNLIHQIVELVHLSIFLLLSFNFIQFANSQTISTIAGSGEPGYFLDGQFASIARLNFPNAVSFGSSELLHFAETHTNRIRLIDEEGRLDTVAGTFGGFSGDIGPATAAQLFRPVDFCFDGQGNLLIVDQGNQRIRKVDSHGIITTFAGNGTQGFSGDGGAAVEAALNMPAGIAVDSIGNVYIADQMNHRVRKVDTNHMISTVVGNGTPAFSGDQGSAIYAEINQPSGLFIDPNDNLYIADTGNQRIRKVDPHGQINTIAGNGTAAFSGDGNFAVYASLNQPAGIYVDRWENIWIADEGNHRIRKIDPEGIIHTVAGNGTAGFAGDGGDALNAQLNHPSDMTVDQYGNIFIADSNNHRIRRVEAFPGILQFSQSVFRVAENVRHAEITVSRLYGTNGEVSVRYITTDGTAVSGSDYEKKTGIITFAHHDSEDKTFTIPILKDAIPEKEETIHLQLLNPSGGAILGERDTATLAILGNRPPTASQQTVSIDEDMSLAINLTGEDPDGDTLQVEVVTHPQHGWLSDINSPAGWVTYHPNHDFNGSDSFHFQMNDGELLSNQTFVRITVHPLNDPPVPIPQTVETKENTSIALTLISNDIDSTTRTYEIASPPHHGTLLNFNPQTGEIIYKPTSEYLGNDAFSFYARDPFIRSPQSATVTIHIHPKIPFTYTPTSTRTPTATPTYSPTNTPRQGNHAPKIDIPASEPIVVRQNQIKMLSVFVTDEENDSVKITLSPETPAHLLKTGKVNDTIVADFQLDTSQIGEFQFTVFAYDGSHATQQSILIWVLNKSRPYTFTPTTTSTSTVTPTLPPTNTPSSTATPSDTPTHPPSPTSSHTPSPTLSPTLSPTPTLTRTATATRTPDYSLTKTPTGFQFPTFTFSPTPTVTFTFTPTLSPSPVPTGIHTKTPRPDNHPPTIDLVPGDIHYVLKNQEIIITATVADADQDSFQISLSPDAPVQKQSEVNLQGRVFIDYRLDTSQLGTFQFTIFADDGFEMTSRQVHYSVVRTLPTHTPTRPATPSPTPTPTLSKRVVVTDNLSSYADLTGVGDHDSRTNRALVIRWDLSSTIPLLTDISSIHIYAKDNQNAPYAFLGRTQTGEKEYFEWNANAQFLATPFRQGPQYGNVYTFRLYALTKSGVPRFYGPFETVGGVEYLPVVTITDTVLTHKDISNEEDRDPPEKIDLVIRWHLDSSEVDSNTIAEYHVYVTDPELGTPRFLGRTDQASKNYLVWQSNSPEIVYPFQEGPQFGKSYRFRVYAITKSGNPRFFGPYENAGAVVVRKQDSISTH